MDQPKNETDLTQKRTVSIRKLEANRKNARKSTGPKTRRGKAYSGRNAIKHGIFARTCLDFIAHGEDREEYEEVLNGLRVQYQPIGMAEELEVERIAFCWWRLKRASRYENAMNHVALRDSGKRERDYQAEWCQEWEKKEGAVIDKLRSAAEEIETTGEISQELKKKIFDVDPGLEPMWLPFEILALQTIAEPGFSQEWQQLSSEQRSCVLASAVITIRIIYLEGLAQSRRSNVQEIAIAQHVIPNGHALDKILRYESAIERQRDRAVNQLERLQRRRQGEMVPPPVSVHLTR